MKTSSKRRVLVSSVSMLLVSTLALGTATFAWFTNNKIVTADGMKVTSSAAKGLQITGQNGEGEDVNAKFWGPKYTFTSDAMIQPISVNYTSDGEYAKITDGWYPGDVKVTGAYSDQTKANFSGWTKNDEFPTVEPGNGTEAAGSNDYFLAYEVGVRATGTEIQNVHLQVNVKDGATGKNASKYMRVAILDQKNSKTQNYKNDEIEMVVGDETTKTADAVSSVSKDAAGVETVAVAPQKIVSGGAASDVNIGTVGKTPQYYTVLVWFEGQDAECIDEFTNAEGLIDLKFFYTDAEQTTTTP